jgi:hypothetical protein
MAIHKNLDTTNGIHIPYSYSYADATARGAATGFVAADLGKFARQTDNNSVWMLTATTPTWLQVSLVIGSGTATNTHILIADGTDWHNKAMSGDATITNAGVVTVTRLPFFIDYPAGSFDYPTSNPAPLDTDTGTNGTIKRQLFDDTTEEFVNGQFQVPTDVDTTGSVTFEAFGYASTADGNEIQLRFGHSAGGDSDTWDLAFTDEDSGDLVTDSTQDDLDYFTWTETLTNLGWAANDQVRFQLSRVAISDGTPVSGDWGLTHFRIRIPRT